VFILFPVICISSGRVFHRLPGRLYHRPLYRQLLPSEASTRATTTAPTGQAGQPGRRKSGRGVGGVPAAVGLLGIWTGIVRTADRRARIALVLWCWRAGAFYVLAHGGDNAGQCCRWVRKGSVERSASVLERGLVHGAYLLNALRALKFCSSVSVVWNRLVG